MKRLSYFLFALFCFAASAEARPNDGKGVKQATHTVSTLECTLLGGTFDMTNGYSCCVGDVCAPIKDNPPPKKGGKGK